MNDLHNLYQLGPVPSGYKMANQAKGGWELTFILPAQYHKVVRMPSSEGTLFAEYASAIRRDIRDSVIQSIQVWYLDLPAGTAQPQTWNELLSSDHATPCNWLPLSQVLSQWEATD